MAVIMYLFRIIEEIVLMKKREYQPAYREYQPAYIEIILFEKEDIITTSGDEEGSSIDDENYHEDL